MSVLFYTLQKEFLLIFRDKMILPMMFLMPIIQLTILPFAVDLDVRHLRLTVIDNDKSSYSQQIISKIGASDIFTIHSIENTYSDAIKKIGKNEADIILHIPQNFEKDLVRNNKSIISISADAVDAIKSGLGTSYLNSIIQNFNHQIRLEWSGGVEFSAPMDVKYSFWYNPLLSYRNYMVPAILVLLLTTLSGFITTLNIVREKEEGTMEQINVTPLKRWQFILGKLIPFWIIGIVIFTLGLLILRYVYSIHIEGSILLLYIFAAVFLVSILGVGLFISILSNTQQQAMFVSYFFIMIFILLSGLFTNIESMPKWAYSISNIIPITHFMHAVRAIVIKGSNFSALWLNMVYILAAGIILNGLSILLYRKTS